MRLTLILSKQQNCIDSTLDPNVVYAGEIEKLKAANMKPEEQITLEPFERDHCVVIGSYSP